MSRNNGKRRPFEFIYGQGFRSKSWLDRAFKNQVKSSFIIVDDIENEEELSPEQKEYIKGLTEFWNYYGFTNENKIKINMETLQINKANALTAYEKANEKGKALLSNLFGKKVFIKDIRERIKTYEDACEYEGIKPLQLSDFDHLPVQDRAYHYHDHRKVIIKRALNEGWVADHSNPNQKKFYVWYKWVGSVRGFSFGGFGFGRTYSFVGARHEFKSRELAEYFASQFIGEVDACFIIK